MKCEFGIHNPFCLTRVLCMNDSEIRLLILRAVENITRRSGDSYG